MVGPHDVNLLHDPASPLDDVVDLTGRFTRVSEDDAVWRELDDPAVSAELHELVGKPALCEVKCLQDCHLLCHLPLGTRLQYVSEVLLFNTQKLASVFSHDVRGSTWEVVNEFKVTER